MGLSATGGVMDEGAWSFGRGGSARQTDRSAAHQLCLCSVVCAGMGMWPKTTSTSSSRAPSTHIRAADLFELCAIVPWQMEVPDRPPQQPNTHVNTHAGNIWKLPAAWDNHQKLKVENIWSILYMCLIRRLM